MGDNQTPGGTPTAAELHGLYQELKGEVTEIRAELNRNTTATEAVKTNTAEVVELLASFRGAFKVLEGLGKVARPLAYISTVVGAVLAAWGAWKAQR